MNYKELEYESLPMGDDFAQLRGTFMMNIDGQDKEYWYVLFKIIFLLFYLISRNVVTYKKENGRWKIFSDTVGDVE
jgi:hypothetical protein